MVRPQRRILSRAGWFALGAATVCLAIMALIMLAGCAPPNDSTPGGRIATAAKDASE